MILIDRREHEGSKSGQDRPMSQLFKGRGVPHETVELDSGDYMFEGNGPDNSTITVGVERKRVGDVLSSCLSGRLSDFQAPKMVEEYDRRYLIIEGSIMPDKDTGMLLKWVRGEGGKSKPVEWKIGQRSIHLSTLRRFLLDFHEFYGMRTMFTMNPTNTVDEICTLYSWWTTPWDRHTGVRQFYEKPLVAGDGTALLRRPGKVARVAKEVDDIGWELAMRLQDQFDTPEEFVLASVDRLLEVEGIGKKTAKGIREWWETGDRE